jgi:hypothetical protein
VTPNPPLRARRGRRGPPIATLAREFVEQARRAGADRSHILHAVVDALAERTKAKAGAATDST